MTEFEIATLAIQQASLDLQQGQLWAAIAIPAVAAVVGVLQAGVVVYGIRAMVRANDRRAEADAQRAEADAQRDQRRADAEAARVRQEDARHAEAMTALRALVQGLERQGAALEAALKGRA